LPLALALSLALALILSAGRSGAASIAFDLTGLSAEAYGHIDGLALERKLALRLVQEGFAVVAPGRGADMEVRAAMTAAGLEFRATSGASLRSVTISLAEAPSAEWQLEVAHKIAELARALAPTMGRTVAPRDDARKPSERAPPVAFAPPVASAPRVVSAPPVVSAPLDSRWEVGLAAGVVFRAGGSDPLVGVSASNSRGRLRLHLDALGTWGFGPEIDVWEAQGSAGVGLAVVDSVLSLDLGLAAGAVIQHFSVASPWAQDRGGTSASPALWAPAHLRWVANHLVIGGRTALGLARTPKHTSEGATLWSRGSLRLEAALVVGWTF
jgi:hypothetical protein